MLPSLPGARLSRAGPTKPHQLARLLKRVFDIDMQHCSNCGAGELKIIAASWNGL